MGTASAITIRGLIPNEGWRIPYSSTTDPLRLSIVEETLSFFEDLATIEGTLGTSLLTRVEEVARREPGGLLKEYETAARIAKTVKAGRGEEAAMQVWVPRSDLLALLIDELRRESTRHVRVGFLGLTLDLGIGEYDFERIAIQDIKPVLDAPSSAAWVTVANVDGSPIQYKLATTPS